MPGDFLRSQKHAIHPVRTALILLRVRLVANAQFARSFPRAFVVTKRITSTSGSGSIQLFSALRWTTPLWPRKAFPVVKSVNIILVTFTPSRTRTERARDTA